MDCEINAQCKCGKLKFTATRAPLLELVCHCADCRDATGQDFTSLVFFKVKYSSLMGETIPALYISDNGAKTQREACAHCSEFMIDRSDGFPGLIGVVAACLNAPFEANPKIHVWTQSKLPNVELPTQIKAFEKGMS